VMGEPTRYTAQYHEGHGGSDIVESLVGEYILTKEYDTLADRLARPRWTLLRRINVYAYERASGRRPRRCVVP